MLRRFIINRVQTSTKELLVKVPEITAFFWIIKVLATTVGETVADFLNTKLGFGLSGTSVATFAALGIVLLIQIRAKEYRPPIFWLAVVLISIAGTLITDNLTDVVGISLVTSSIVFALCLAIVFGVWYLRENTLAMHSIYTPVREAFYWSAILATFALGTATGDLFAERLQLGYGNSFIVFTALIAIIAALWKVKALNSVFAFWAIYILTRPLGASIGDFLSQSKKAGGIGLGTTATSAIFLSAILITVSYLVKSKRDQIKV